jgi:ribosomal-protein-alanine N-acetyltransferase
MPRTGRPPHTSTASLRIRRARPSDAARLAEIEAAVFPTDRISRRRFAALAKRPSARILLACRGRDIVGYAILLTRRGIRTARLYSLAVAPEAAGQGIGRRLLAEVEAAARRQRMQRLRLEVRADNPRAIRLYKEAGYGLIGHRSDYYADGMEALLFARELPPVVRRPRLLRRAA